MSNAWHINHAEHAASVWLGAGQAEVLVAKRRAHQLNAKAAAVATQRAARQVLYYENNWRRQWIMSTHTHLHTHTIDKARQGKATAQTARTCCCFSCRMLALWLWLCARCLSGYYNPAETLENDGWKLSFSATHANPLNYFRMINALTLAKFSTAKCSDYRLPHHQQHQHQKTNPNIIKPRRKGMLNEHISWTLGSYLLGFCISIFLDFRSRCPKKKIVLMRLCFTRAPIPNLVSLALIVFEISQIV